MDIDLETFTRKLIHVCCSYRDENYLQNAKENGDLFPETSLAVNKVDAFVKKLLVETQKIPEFKESFDRLKLATEIKQLDNNETVILFIESEKSKKTLCVKKSDLVFYRAFFEMYFYEKCCKQRYLSYTKQIQAGEETFNTFAWSEWQLFSEQISVLINLLCQKKKTFF